MTKWGRTLVGGLLLVLLALPAVAATGSFTDDDGSVHEADIEAIAVEGITRGCNPPVNDRFCPSDGVTRGQMAAFLVRALGLSDDGGGNSFVDDDGSVFEADIARLAAAGITRGCNPPVNDRFCPSDGVTRGQMAAFLVRALGLSDDGGGNSFVDDDGLVFEGDIARLAAAGITRGCNPPENDRFCPSDVVTRGQMASFLTRALDLEPIVPEPNDPAWYTTPTPQGLGARTIVVSPAGSPTLDEALNSAQPGDIIELQPGTHVNVGGNISLDVSGTSDQWIAIRGAEGSRPVIDLEGSGEFRLSGSYVIVENVEIVDGGGNNLHIAPGSASITDIVVRDVVIHSLRSGPGAAIKINRNNGAGAGVSRVYIEGSDLSESISNAVVDGVGVSRVVLRDSWVHDNAVGSHGVFFKGGSSEILIERNLISGIRQNAALQLGGNTGARFFDPDHADWEGVDQVARNNLVADFDDSAIEIRGVDGGRVYNNTIVTQTGFAIYRLSCGNTDAGGTSANADIEIANNLVVGTGGDPQYARNDCGPVDLTFGPTGWFGQFRNSGSSTPDVPTFPIASDSVAQGTAGVVVDPTHAGLTGLPDALGRYVPVSKSPALTAGSGNQVALADILGVARDVETPSLGAFEDSPTSP